MLQLGRARHKPLDECTSAIHPIASVGIVPRGDVPKTDFTPSLDHLVHIFEHGRILHYYRFQANPAQVLPSHILI